MTRAQDITNRVDIKGHASRLARVLTPRYLDLLELGWDAEIAGAFDVKNPAVRALTRTLATRVVGMADTTKDDIRGVLERAFDADKIPGTDVIARQLREAGVTSSRSRSEMISRTETATAFNQGALLSYTEAGVEKVECLDSDNDPECEERNGKVFTVEEAQEIEPHPNCVLAWAPIVS
jgi:SPP1 gp7 family putative phage head morphogenesis protein